MRPNDPPVASGHRDRLVGRAVLGLVILLGVACGAPGPGDVRAARRGPGTSEAPATPDLPPATDAPTIDAPAGPGEDGVRPVVAVVGDSITFITTEELQAGAEVRRYRVEAVLGATSLQLVDEARHLAAARPDQVILNVGTNDALRRAEPSDTVAVVRMTVELFASARCVHLTTVNRTMAGDPGLAARVDAINAGYERLARSVDRVHLIDWDGHLRDHVRAGRPGGPLVSDTVHPTELGQRQLAELYLDAAERCPRRSPAPNPGAGSRGLDPGRAG